MQTYVIAISTIELLPAWRLCRLINNFCPKVLLNPFIRLTMDRDKIKGIDGSSIIHRFKIFREKKRRSFLLASPTKVNFSFVLLSTFIFYLILSPRRCDSFILSTTPSVTSKIIWQLKFNTNPLCDLPSFFQCSDDHDGIRTTSSFCVRPEGQKRLHRLTSLYSQYGTFHPEPDNHTNPPSQFSKRNPPRSLSQLKATSSENLKAESTDNGRRGRGRPPKKSKEDTDDNKSTHSWSGGVARLARAAAKAAAEASERENHYNGYDASSDNNNNNNYDSNSNTNSNNSISQFYQPSWQRANNNFNGSFRPKRVSPFKTTSSGHANSMWNIGPPRKQEAVSPSADSANGAENNKRGTMGSLRQLTKVIDKQLFASGPRGVWKSNYPRAEGPLVHQARDSMSSLLGYNQVKGDWKSHSSMSTYNVAFVFGKRLVNDQITVEYASRIRTLVKLFKNEPEFRPSLVCFCGGRSSANNHVADADAGYLFFRHICNINGINLTGVNVFIDNISTTDEEAIRRVTNEVMHNYAPEWLQRSNNRILSMNTVTENNLPETSGGQHPPYDGNTHKKDKTMESYERQLMNLRNRMNKIQVHFTLVSTEYYLCNINDIHHRSPNQSLLKAIEKMGVNTNLETSWSFQYATYPYVYAKDEAVMFLGKCYLLGEELVPLVLNLRGVVDSVSLQMIE